MSLSLVSLPAGERARLSLPTWQQRIKRLIHAGSVTTSSDIALLIMSYLPSREEIEEELREELRVFLPKYDRLFECDTKCFYDQYHKKLASELTLWMYNEGLHEWEALKFPEIFKPFFSQVHLIYKPRTQNGLCINTMDDFEKLHKQHYSGYSSMVDYFIGDSLSGTIEPY
jgi:hypothetical protein